MEFKNNCINKMCDERIKGMLLLFCIYLFLYIFNYYTPMGFGDDYLYAFIWQGNPEFVPLSEDAVRVSSFHDIFISQQSHYFTWGGRTVNHSIAQFFLWLGKGTFNFFNALIGTLLVAAIYWIINKGRISLCFNPKIIWMIAFALWAFSPGFVTVFLWLEGACNYLWTATILVVFLLPYVKKYYHQTDIVKNDTVMSFLMFLFGILTSWTNENSICWIILMLLFFLFTFRRNLVLEKWLYAGVFGLIIGYSLLIFAPGNINRLQSAYGMHWMNESVIISNIKTFLIVITFQIFMWHFVLKAFYKLGYKEVKDASCKKDILLAKVFGVIAFGMSVVMLLSPVFPLRSGFPGTVQLIVSAGILWRIYRSYSLNFMDKRIIKTLLCLSYIYFVVTSIVSFTNLYKLHIETNDIISIVVQAKQKNNNIIIEIPQLTKSGRLESLLSGFHLIENELTEDENSWENVAFSRYYGIKGIRVISRKNFDE